MRRDVAAGIVCLPILVLAVLVGGITGLIIAAVFGAILVAIVLDTRPPPPAP